MNLFIKKKNFLVMSRVSRIINRHTLSLEVFDWTLPETTGYRYISNYKKDGKRTEGCEGSEVVDWSRKLTWTSGKPSVPLFVLLPVLE